VVGLGLGTRAVAGVDAVGAGDLVSVVLGWRLEAELA
jgi:hypothetical protein